MRTTKSVTISLPPEQLKTAERLAKQQNRTMSELFREGLRRMEQEEQGRLSPAALAQFRDIVQLIRQDARQTGLDQLSPEQIDAEVQAVRKPVHSQPTPASKKSRQRPGR